MSFQRSLQLCDCGNWTSNPGSVDSPQHFILLIEFEQRKQQNLTLRRLNIQSLLNPVIDSFSGDSVLAWTVSASILCHLPSSKLTDKSWLTSGRPSLLKCREICGWAPLKSAVVAVNSSPSAHGQTEQLSLCLCFKGTVSKSKIHILLLACCTIYPSRLFSWRNYFLSNWCQFLSVLTAVISHFLQEVYVNVLAWLDPVPPSWNVCLGSISVINKQTDR